VLLKVAINGARPKSENQHIPQSLDEIENEVRAIYEIGYQVFHIHSYDKNENESLKPDDVDSLVTRVKRISRNIQIGISSGGWIEPNFTKRIDYIKNWTHLPDFISVNMIEENALEVAGRLIERGIYVEVGLNEKKAAEIFVKSKLSAGVCRILIEPEEENLAGAVSTINEIENVLDVNNIKTKRLLHGFNSVAWDLLREAKKRGYDGRMGMEDTIYLENGEKVKSNLGLIREAGKIVGAV